MDSKLMTFENAAFGKIRTITIDGEPWFVAVDVCKALQIANSRDALTRIDDDEKGVVLTDTLGGKQEVTIVNEPGLYTLVLSSRKPEAKAFKRWITHEVIPAIRKYGGYMTKSLLEQVLENPNLIYEFARRMLEEQQKNERLRQELDRAKPKADYYDAFIHPESCTNIRATADGLPALVSNVAAAMPKVGGIPLHVNAAQVINDKKVSDHHAVIPTANLNENALAGLPAGERAVLELVALRLLCAVAQSYEYTETAVTLECAGHSFSAKGCTVMNPGWRALMEAHYSGKGENETSDAAKALPPMDEGQTFTVHSAAVKEGKTTPPKHYTEDICCERGIRNHP